ncbi:hypothetical protein TL16_g06614 [Triparma laevis f. inornata]|uniref:Pentatricopeptide repeat-containing protein n=1 Tax=Triparma laevis f. inornata TaxID=1714386 RepID=A0A9W7EFT5_9STRA|nr:hypothetical protein TL16_g06614 [Triparma laevis f. inornata]
MNSSSSQILSTLTHHAQKSKKKKSESQKTFDHLIHCCCRHNSLPAALALYGYLRERLMRNNRDKRGIGGGEEGGSVGGSVRGGVQGDEKVASTITIASATETQLELDIYPTPPLTNPTLQSFASDPTIHMNSKIYSTLLSLCSGVSPSDYLSSGATNKPTDPTSSSNSEPVNNPTATSTYNWSSQILELYNTLPTSTSISFSSRYGFAKILQNDLLRHEFQLNEIGYTALIRVACKCGDEKNAVDLLRKAEEDKSVKKRNRMFFDVLCLKCTTPNVDITYVFNLWKRMEIQGLKVREEEMMWSLRGCKDWGEVGGANYVVNTVGEEVFVPEEGMREVSLREMLGGLL